MQSGSALNPWASIKNSKEYGYRLADSLGFKEDDPKKVVEFLRTVKYMKLVKAANNILTPEVSSN